MKLSELISELQAIKGQIGDAEVVRRDHMDWRCHSVPTMERLRRWKMEEVKFLPRAGGGAIPVTVLNMDRGGYIPEARARHQKLPSEQALVLSL